MFTEATTLELRLCGLCKLQWRWTPAELLENLHKLSWKYQTWKTLNLAMAVFFSYLCSFLVTNWSKAVLKVLKVQSCNNQFSSTRFKRLSDVWSPCNVATQLRTFTCSWGRWHCKNFFANTFCPLGLISPYQPSLRFTLVSSSSWENYVALWLHLLVHNCMSIRFR